MSLLSRLSTLLKADAHGMVDALEERSLLLRQHLRDARNAVSHQRDRLESLEAQIQDLEAAQRRLSARREALDADVSLALEQQQEELARFAIRKLLPTQRRLEEMARRYEEMTSQRDELSMQLEEQETELQELKVRVQDYLQRRRANEGSGNPGDPESWQESATADAIVADEEVELELLRRRGAATPEAAT